MRISVFTLALYIAPTPLASAQSEIDRDLALALAKTTLNEASFGASPADLYLIWQITEARGRTNERRLEWLRRHSSCVNTNRPMSAAELRSNCRWTRNLGWSDAQPEGWPAGFPWLRRHRERWSQMRRVSLALVRGRVYTRPCPVAPSTWGGRVIDLAQALARGLRPVGCRGTANEGFVLASRLDG
jgi:hypothetical protein